MRRLATQNRGGAVSSNRDYQTILSLGKPLRITPIRNREAASITVRFDCIGDIGDSMCFGAYLSASVDSVIEVVIRDSNREDQTVTISLESQRHWTRTGFVWLQSKKTSYFELILRWDKKSIVDIWGMQVSKLNLPNFAMNFVLSDPDGVMYLNNKHLAPEAFYLKHDAPITGSSSIRYANATQSQSPKANIGKKCSQCQRALPVDPRLADLRTKSKTKERSPASMVLAFHGHKSKKTGYQNECRACKKFEINEHFNELRTADQLNESSVLTRERKLLLKDNAILETFKDRSNKRGLRYHVWTKFSKSCFKCKRSVKLNGFELDHTRPLVYLWPLDEFATCLCPECNNQKKDSFPVDFYSPRQLSELSQVCGLSVDKLKTRSVNLVELGRIRSDLATFAANWSPRLFASIATRVKELHPSIDLFRELESAHPDAYLKIRATLDLRPSSIELSEK